MKEKSALKFTALLFAASVVVMGCTNNQPPDVVTTPGPTTVVHDQAPTPAPSVTVQTPAPSSSHTETNTTTTTPASPGSMPATSTSTTTTGG